MNVDEAIQTLLAVRDYEARAIPPEAIRRILEAGRMTASASNTQPWHFIVVEDRESLRRLGELAPTGPYVADAAMAIAVVVPHKVIAVSDASRAIQSMMLTAWSEGIGSNWVGFRGMDEIEELLEVPDDLDILAILPFGYPASPVGKGRKQRKALPEVASRERFGEPFE